MRGVWIGNLYVYPTDGGYRIWHGWRAVWLHWHNVEGRGRSPLAAVVNLVWRALVSTARGDAA